VARLDKPQEVQMQNIFYQNQSSVEQNTIRHKSQYMDSEFNEFDFD